MRTKDIIHHAVRNSNSKTTYIFEHYILMAQRLITTAYKYKKFTVIEDYKNTFKEHKWESVLSTLDLKHLINHSQQHDQQ